MHKFFDEKQRKNVKKTYVNNIIYTERTPLTRDVTWSKLSRYGESIADQKLSVERIRSKLVINH